MPTLNETLISEVEAEVGSKELAEVWIEAPSTSQRLMICSPPAKGRGPVIDLLLRMEFGVYT